VNEFIICSNKIKWRNDTESASIELCYPVIFPSKPSLFSLRKESRQKRIEQIVVPDEILKIFFKKDTLRIIKGENRLVVNFNSRHNKRKVVFWNDKTMVSIDGDKVRNLPCPIKTILHGQERIYLIPIAIIMQQVHYYDVSYDMKQEKVILVDRFNKFSFTKKDFPTLYPLPK